MAALTAVTVGGVYANFVYSDENKMESATSGTTIQLAGAIEEGAAGTLALEARQLNILIDSAASIMGADKPADVDAHKAMIKATGSITLTFTPRVGLQETEILDNAIPAEISFAASWGAPENFTYAWDTDNDDVAENIQIFKAVPSIKTTIHKADETDKAIRWTKGENGVFTCTITAEQLFGEGSILGADLLEINDVVLETKAEYEAFRAAFTDPEGIFNKRIGVTLAMTTAHAE